VIGRPPKPIRDADRERALAEYDDVFQRSLLIEGAGANVYR
jgi:hypothetical protein